MPFVYKSTAAELTLDEVTERMAHHPSVEGIVTLGTTASGSLNPASDYDLFVVLSEGRVPLWLVVTTIDRRLAEIYFAPVRAIDELSAAGAPAQPDSYAAILARFLREGLIAFDRRGRLAQAAAQVGSQLQTPPVGDNAIYSTWFGVNYNLLHALRMLTSDDPVYTTALDIRLLYCVADVVTTYFRVRGLPWRGEKAAVRQLAAEDPRFLELFQQFAATNDRRQKVELYRTLAEAALAPAGRLWPPVATTLQLGPEASWTTAMVDAGLELWEALIDRPGSKSTAADQTSDGTG